MKRVYKMLRVLGCAGLVGLSGCNSSDSNSTEVAAEPQETQNMKVVTRFYVDVLGKDNTGLITELFAADFVQHDSGESGGPDGQVMLVQDLKARIPGLIATIKHIGSDGEYVLVHWHASATPLNESSGQAAADLYRVSKGKIAEHWGKFQMAPPTTASGNSMFSDLYDYKGVMPAVTENQEAKNKDMVVAAYKGLFNDHDLTLLDKYWDPKYLQHNPWVPNGTDGLRQLIGGMPTGGPKLEFAQTIADGDLVYTMALNSMPGASGPTTSLLTDIFRVVDSKIVEHWDIQ